MRKRIVAFVFAASLVIGMATPALAAVHGFVPADECADGNGNAAAHAANTVQVPNGNQPGQGGLTQGEQDAIPCPGND